MNISTVYEICPVFLTVTLYDPRYRFCYLSEVNFIKTRSLQPGFSIT